MKPFLISIFFFWCSLMQLQAQITIETDGGTAPLKDVIMLLENKHDLLFSYKESLLEDVDVVLPSGKLPVAEFLQFILQKKKITFKILEDDYVVLKSKKEPEEIEEELPVKIKLCGTVFDAVTKLPLGFANVYLKKSQTGVVAQEDGSFTLSVGENIQDTLIVSYIGYEERAFPTTVFVKKPCQNIALNYFDYGENFIVITDYLTSGIQKNDNGGHTNIQVNKMGALPGLAEPDVLKTIQFLPGITAPDGTASGICIRGGTPDQNLILWEDIPVYHAAHYFGMLSAFNPYIISEAKVFRGGFGAEYGGRISGIIDLKSDINPYSRRNFGAGVNLLNAFTNGQIQLLKKKIGLVYSVRRSISDWWESPSFESISEKVERGILLQDVDLRRELEKEVKIKSDVYFLDTNIKADYTISDKDKLEAAFFYADNDLRSGIDDTQRDEVEKNDFFLNNIGTGISWQHNWSPTFSAHLSGFYTHYDYDYKYRLEDKVTREESKFETKKGEIKEQQLHFYNKYYTKSKHFFRLGYQLTHYDVSFKLGKKSRPDDDRNGKSGLHILYGTFNTGEDKKMGLDVGFRLNYFKQKNKVLAEPRLRLWYNISNTWNLHANAGKYDQFVGQLVEIVGDKAGIEMPIWVLAGKDAQGQREMPIQRAWHGQIGAVFRKKNWLVDLQLYYRYVNGLSSLTTGFDETTVGEEYSAGNSRSRGLDILVKKRWNNYRFWVSYSLSKFDYHFPRFFDKNFPAPVDQRHVFDIANLWTWRDFEFSLGWKVATGKPFSRLENFRIQNPMDMEEAESIYPIEYKYNDARLPLQHQVDASILYSFLPKSSQSWKAVFGLSFFNLYHQKNIYTRDIFIDDPRDEPAELRYSKKFNLGFTPNVVVRVEW